MPTSSIKKSLFIIRRNQMQKLAVLRSRPFRLLLLTRAVASMGLQAQAVIVGWQIYSITKDVWLLGLTGLVEAVPAIACALVAGHFVDNGNPKKLYLICLATLAANTLALLLIAGGIIQVPGGNIIPWIFAGLFISGLARGFLSPCSFTLLSRIVTKNDMPSAAAWMSSGLQTASVVGPATAGIIYGGYGATAAWFLPTMLLTCAVMMLAGLKVTHTASNTEKREPAWKSITTGWKYILNNQVLLSMMTLDMFAVLFGGAVAMLPAVADQVLHTGSEGLGILRAAPAVGAIVTGITLAVYPMRHISALRLLVVVAGFGVCMIGFGLSTSFWLSVILLIISGCFDSVSMIIRGTLMQLLTPDNMKGRLSSINSMFIISSNEIGAFESGTAARLLGLVPSIVFGGVCTILVVAATAALAPKFRKTVIDTKQP